MSSPEIPLQIRLKAKKVCDILIRYYGKAVSSRKLPPLDELVMTILSQHTSDVNMFRSFESLKERYSTWEEVLEAPQDELALFIKSSGMFNLKAKRIQAALREIHLPDHSSGTRWYADLVDRRDRRRRAVVLDQ